MNTSSDDSLPVYALRLALDEARDSKFSSVTWKDLKTLASFAMLRTTQAFTPQNTIENGPLGREQSANAEQLSMSSDTPATYNLTTYTAMDNMSDINCGLTTDIRKQELFDIPTKPLLSTRKFGSYEFMIASIPDVLQIVLPHKRLDGSIRDDVATEAYFNRRMSYTKKYVRATESVVAYDPNLPDFYPAETVNCFEDSSCSSAACEELLSRQLHAIPKVGIPAEEYLTERIVEMVHSIMAQRSPNFAAKGKLLNYFNNSHLSCDQELEGQNGRYKCAIKLKLPCIDATISIVVTGDGRKEAQALAFHRLDTWVASLDATELGILGLEVCSSVTPSILVADHPRATMLLYCAKWNKPAPILAYHQNANQICYVEASFDGLTVTTPHFYSKKNAAIACYLILLDYLGVDAKYSSAPPSVRNSILSVAVRLDAECANKILLQFHSQLIE